jgi:hypothetical protein
MKRPDELAPSAPPAADKKRVRIHAVDAFVDVDVLAPFQERMDALAREKPALVEHIANLGKGRG